MPRGEGIHVVPRSGQWGIDGEGAPGSTFGTQQEAIDAATQLAKQQQTELVVHGEDGQIRERNSYGNDPRSIKG